MGDFEDPLREMEGNLIVAGDFNAKAVEWGMDRSDTRGKPDVEMVSILGLVVLNTGTTTTFHRPGYSETIFDISFSSMIQDWQVTKTSRAVTIKTLYSL